MSSYGYRKPGIFSTGEFARLVIFLFLATACGIAAHRLTCRQKPLSLLCSSIAPKQQLCVPAPEELPK